MSTKLPYSGSILQDINPNRRTICIKPRLNQRPLYASVINGELNLWYCAACWDGELCETDHARYESAALVIVLAFYQTKGHAVLDAALEEALAREPDNFLDVKM